MGQLFEIRHESDLGEYSSTVTGSGDLSRHASAALAGSVGGLKVVVNDTDEIYGRKDFTATGELRLRVYVKPNSLSIASGSAMRFLWLKNAAGTTMYNLYMGISGSTYTVTLYSVNDSSAWINVGTGNLVDSTTCYIEMYLKCATAAGANNGISRVWINGSLACEATTIDNDNLADDINQLRAGKSDIGTVSGTFYIDEIVVRNDSTEIGPRVGLVPFWRLYRGLRS